MKTIVFISGVSGVGKTSICEYIKNNNALKEYTVFDIDDLENINDYNKESYTLFYKNAINKALELSQGNIILGCCINPKDIDNINIPSDIKMILITCSNKELENRLKKRDKERNCSSDEFIKSQIDYQDYMLKQLNKYDLHIDNTNKNIEEVTRIIIDYINKNLK